MLCNLAAFNTKVHMEDAIDYLTYVILHIELIVDHREGHGDIRRFWHAIIWDVFIISAILV